MEIEMLNAVKIVNENITKMPKIFMPMPSFNKMTTESFCTIFGTFMGIAFLRIIFASLKK
jgi:hypothetical protein